MQSLGRAIRGGTAIVIMSTGLAASGAPLATAAPSSAPAPGPSVALAGDGKIAYVQGGDISTINPDGTGMTALVTDGVNAGRHGHQTAPRLPTSTPTVTT